MRGKVERDAGKVKIKMKASSTTLLPAARSTLPANCCLRRDRLGWSEVKTRAFCQCYQITEGCPDAVKQVANR